MMAKSWEKSEVKWNSSSWFSYFREWAFLDPAGEHNDNIGKWLREWILVSENAESDSQFSHLFCMFPWETYLSVLYLLLNGKIIVLMSKDCWKMRNASMHVENLAQSLAHSEIDSTLALIVFGLSFNITVAYTLYVIHTAGLLIRSNYCKEYAFLVFRSKSCLFLPGPGCGVAAKAFVLNPHLSLSVREWKRRSGNSDIYIFLVSKIMGGSIAFMWTHMNCVWCYNLQIPDGPSIYSSGITCVSNSKVLVWNQESGISQIQLSVSIPALLAHQSWSLVLLTHLTSLPCQKALWLWAHASFIFPSVSFTQNLAQFFGHGRHLIQILNRIKGLNKFDLTPS